jgi:hypothetical protein
MATYKHLRSSTASKRPTTGIADGQLAINTNTASPGLFFKDSAGTGIVKVGPVHVGTTAPNATPAAGGSSGNYLGEQWLDTSVSPAQMKVWNGSAWVGIVADELPVSKLQDGAARQLLQTDAAGTGVEWTSNVDVPGTLDVTSTATFDSIALHPLGSAAAPTLTFTGDPNTGIYSPGADQVAVATGGTGRVFVDSSGRVGVGVTPSSTLFHVYTSAPSTISAPTICLEGGTNAYGAGVEFASRTSAGGTLVSMAKITADGEAPWNTTASTQDAGLRFFTAADGSLSERLRITSAGLVGIGTSSPAERLTVNGAVAVTGGITGHGANRTTLSQEGLGGAFWQSYGADTSTPGVFQLRQASSDFSVSRVPLFIDSSGRLGIGTSTPTSAKLDVRDDVNYPVRWGSTSAQFGELSYGTGECVIGATTGNKLTLRSAGTAAITIDTSQRVGIGTATVNRELVLYKASAPAFHIQNSTSGTGEFDGFAFSSAGADATIWNYENGYLRFGTNDTERMRITSDAYVRLAAGTGGIQFNGDTAAANALDDYEEGTFTLTMAGSSTAGTVTYGTRKGEYTKIGNLVTARFYIDWSDFTGTGDMRFGGLPFTASNDQNAGACVTSGVDLPAGTVNLTAFAFNLQSYAIIVASTDNGASANVQCDAQGTFFGCLTYNI